jgi:hypothetical protein
MPRHKYAFMELVGLLDYTKRRLKESKDYPK